MIIYPKNIVKIQCLFFFFFLKKENIEKQKEVKNALTIKVYHKLKTGDTAQWWSEFRVLSLIP